MPGGALQTPTDNRQARRLLKAVAVAGGLCVGVRLLAAKVLALLLYHPFRYEEDPDHEAGLQRYAEAFRKLSYRLEQVHYPVSSAGGWQLFGRSQTGRLLLLSPDGPAPDRLWAIFGGNAMAARDWLSFLLELLDRHTAEGAPRPAFLLVDYPGYGVNSGRPAPGSVLRGQLAALGAALPRLAQAPTQLHLLGHSLGAAAAAQLACALPTAVGAAGALAPGRLVLSAPFLSIEAMAKSLFGGGLLRSLLFRLLVTHRWSNAEWVPKAARAGWRVSIIHGSEDVLVPVWMGRSLRDSVQAIGEECEMVEVAKAGHNDLLSRSAQYAALLGLAARGSSL